MQRLKTLTVYLGLESLDIHKSFKGIKLNVCFLKIPFLWEFVWVGIFRVGNFRVRILHARDFFHVDFFLRGIFIRVGIFPCWFFLLGHICRW